MHLSSAASFYRNVEVESVFYYGFFFYGWFRKSCGVGDAV